MSKHKSEISQAEFDRIERYLLGHMDGAEQRAFESELAANAELREEVALQRRLMAAVELGAFDPPKQEGPALVAYPPRRKPIRIGLYAAAAVVVCALGYFGWWFFRPGVPAEADLYATYFYPDPGLPIAMSSTERYAFYDGMVSYKEENYAEAIQRWHDLPADMLTTDTVQYYLGVASLNNGDLNSAAAYLQRVIADGHSPFHDKAVWYRALIHVNRREYQEATRLLEGLPSENRVDELLERLGWME